MAENKVVEILAKDINTLIENYNTIIEKKDFNQALNVWKNVQMVTQTLVDIKENVNFGNVFEDLSKCWNYLDNKDDISKAIVGERNTFTFEELIKKYGMFITIEFECAKQNLYYNEHLAQSLQQNGYNITLNQYKRFLNCKQYLGRTYIDTIIERNKNNNIKG